MKLKELEKRLKHEPTNLGLRVTVAAQYQGAGRTRDAVELYRSVALAYRDQGRTQQALAVCRSILELVPEDPACKKLLIELLAPASDDPARRSSAEPTPLPKPMPHHDADPSHQRISSGEVTDVDRDLPATEGATTRPGAEDKPSVEGLAQAARTISGLFATETARPTPFEDLSNELDTRQRPRIESEQLRRVSLPPPTAPVERVEIEETAPRRREPPALPVMKPPTRPPPVKPPTRPPPVVTIPPRKPAPRDTPPDNEDELTEPRDRAEPEDD